MSIQNDLANLSFSVYHDGRPLLLDLFCGGGGASVGYEKAGFRIIGVDAQKGLSYPGQYYVDDAICFFLKYHRYFSCFHASPPCQNYSRLKSFSSVQYGDFYTPLKSLLDATGKPYVIENVTQSPIKPNCILTGNMFGLELIRKRAFETNFFIMTPPKEKQRNTGFIDVVGNCHKREIRNKAIGCEWMTYREQSNAIPPEYTEYVGSWMYDVLKLPKSA